MQKNYVQFNKCFKFSALALLLSFSNVAFGYEFTVTNATGQDIALNIYGVGVGGMMQGIYKNDGILDTQKYRVQRFGNNEIINNAGHLDVPKIITNGHTVKLKFTNWDIGVCFDLSHIEVGLKSNGYNMVDAEVQALPNAWYDKVFNAVQSSGGDVTKIGEAIGKSGDALGQVATVIPHPAGQAVLGAASAATEAAGLATEAIGGLVDKVGQLVRSSSCKHMNFVAVRTNKNPYTVTLLTRQQ